MQENMQTLGVPAVKNLRKEMSLLHNSLKTLSMSRYISLSITNLEEARMVLGDVLAVLGEEYPYKEGNYQPADVTSDVLVFMEEMTFPMKLKAFRQVSRSFTELVLEWLTGPWPLHAATPKDAVKFQMALNEAYGGLRKTTLWLGMELGQALERENNRERDRDGA